MQKFCVNILFDVRFIGFDDPQQEAQNDFGSFISPHVRIEFKLQFRRVITGCLTGDVKRLQVDFILLSLDQP